jgi:hypothetical protein
LDQQQLGVSVVFGPTIKGASAVVLRPTKMALLFGRDRELGASVAEQAGICVN